MEPLQELMTAKEVRDYLKCSNEKVYELMKSRGFPSFKIGRSYRVRKGDFAEWINKQNVKD